MVEIVRAGTQDPPILFVLLIAAAAGSAPAAQTPLILVVTSRGMVATEVEEREITVGDVVHIKAGERHWHGASADSKMSHITVTAVGSQSTHG